MADQDEPQPPVNPVKPVGSVAEEAARLLDALGGWVSTSGYGAAPAHAHASDPDVPDVPDAQEASGEAGTVPPGETRSHGPGHCDQCGAANGTGQAVTCQWCPLCQGIGLLRSVRPETVDRLADLAGALATALRDVATQTRSASGTPPGTPGGPTAPHEPRTRGPRVQDITIDDEDQGSATR